MRTVCREQNGWALPVLLAVITIVLAAAGLLLHRATAAERVARLERQAENAFYVAEAGLQKAVAWTYKSDGFEWTGALPGDQRRREVWAQVGDDAELVGEYELDWKAESSGYWIKSSGHAGRARRVICAYMEWWDPDVAVLSYAETEADCPV